MNRKNKHYNKKEIKIIRDNYKLISYKELAELLGRSESSIRNKIYELDELEKKGPNRWTDAEIEWLINIYKESENICNLNLDMISKQIGKHKTNICRKAKELGLTYSHRIKTEEQNIATGIRTKLYLERNEHPKGMLGKHHSDEFKKNQSIIMTGIKQNISDEERLRRSNQARENIKKALSNGNCFSRTKSGIRKDIGNIFFRSSWEANFARVLNIENRNWKYEPKDFKINDSGDVYIPDFYLPEEDIWVEVKGWLMPNNKKKLKLFMESNKEIAEKLYFLIDKKDSKTSLYLKKIGYDKQIYYNEIRIKYKNKINWEGD